MLQLYETKERVFIRSYCRTSYGLEHVSVTLVWGQRQTASLNRRSVKVRQFIINEMKLINLSWLLAPNRRKDSMARTFISTLQLLDHGDRTCLFQKLITLLSPCRLSESFMTFTSRRWISPISSRSSLEQKNISISKLLVIYFLGKLNELICKVGMSGSSQQFTKTIL